MLKSNQLIGEGIFSTKDGNPFYTQLSLPISYFDSQIPDTASIYITLVDSTNSILSVASYAIIDDINFDPASDIESETGAVDNFRLEQNYPNPFNPGTAICYELPVGSYVTLKIFNSLGEAIEKLIDNEYQDAGTHSSLFIANSSLPSGVYFYQLKAVDPSTGSGQGFLETKKMILIK
jgi:hypothetical protein